MTIGLICEYNPFHNGHIYHINKIKELFPNSTLIVVISNNFTERGEISILSKKEKTSIALNHGIDLVVELPFVYSSQSADAFALGNIKILEELKVDYLVFGSESNDIDKLTLLAKTQLEDSNYSNLVKEYMNKGINYPTAMSKALKDITNIDISEPNDILGLSYIKEIIRQKSSIKPITIKRTNDYHESGSEIRKNLHNDNIKKYVPIDVYNILKNKPTYNYFNYLKYKILTTRDLSKIQTVDEGIENRIIKYINNSKNLDDFINNIKTKRYTYNKISRMNTHILTDFTKDEANDKDLKYIRVLGFNTSGKNYLNKIKKDTNIKIITNIKKSDEELLKTDIKVEQIYNLITDGDINSYKDPVIFLK